MSYSLKKLFNIDREKYDSEYQKRFNSPDTVHLNFKINGERAFVCQTSKILNTIISIERTDKHIRSLHKALPHAAIDHFEKRCLIDEIVLSNNIEGVHSTRKELNAILSDLSEKNKHKRFYGLVNKYTALMNSDKIQLETCGDIRKIYDDIFLDEIKQNDPQNEPDGQIFRKHSVSVYSATGKEVHTGLYPEEKIIEVMGDALLLLKNDALDILIRISIFHYLFGYIHPFYDGNGRTDRFISSYLLSQELDQLIGYRLSYTIKENISKYYKAFDTCNHPLNKADLTPFVEMFLDIINISHKQLLFALEKRVNELTHYQGILTRHFSNENERVQSLYFILVQAALFSNTGVSTQELSEHTKTSPNTLRRMLKEMPNGLLITNKTEKTHHYLINLDELDKIYS